MTLAQRALTQVMLCDAKKQIEDLVIHLAGSGKRLLQLPCLPITSEHREALVQWMEDEGLKVQYVETKEKPSGLGAMLCEDDELQTVSHYTISW